MNGFCHLQGVSKEMLSVYEMASQSSIFKVQIKIIQTNMLLMLLKNIKESVYYDEN